MDLTIYLGCFLYKQLEAWQWEQEGSQEFYE